MTSKRFFTVMMILLLLFSLSVGNMGCGSSSRGAIPSGNDNNNAVYYVVSFDSNGGSEVASVKVTSGSTIEAPTAPTKEGYTFAGWYKDNNTFQNIFTFGTGGEKITADITLYAKWAENDALVAEYALSEIVIGYGTGDNPNYVTQNLTLPTKINSSDISWTSNSGAVASDGTVTRQDADTDVTLTATASYNGKSASRTFNVKVIKKRTRVNSEITPLTIDAAKSGDVTVTKNSSGDVTDIEGQYVSFDIDNADDALDAVTVLKNELGVKNPANELGVFSVSSHKHGAEYQFKQIYNGVKVLGRGVMVSANANGGGDFLHSNLLSSDVIVKADGKADIGQSAAENSAKAAYAGSIEVDTARTEKVIYSFDDYKTAPVYAYIVNIYGTADDKVIDEKVLVNAENGNLISKTSNIFDFTAHGLNELSDDVNFEVETTSFLGKTTYHMYSPENHVKMYNKSRPFQITSDSEVWTDRQQVSVYTNMIEIMKWWKNTFGRDSLDGKGGFVDVVTHTGDKTNAYWSNGWECIYVEDGKIKNYTHGADIDVLTHETAHGVMFYMADNFDGTHTITRVILEGYADIFACVKKNDWKLAEVIVKDTGLDCYRNIAYPEDPKSFIGYALSTGQIGSDDTYLQSIKLISNVAYLMHEDYAGKDVGLTWDELGQVWYYSMAMGLWLLPDHFDLDLLHIFPIASEFTPARLEYSSVYRCVTSAATKLGLSKQKTDAIDNAFYIAWIGTTSHDTTVSPDVDVTPEEPTTGDIPIDKDHFTDSIFRDYIFDKCDKNHDAMLNQEEIAQTVSIDLPHWIDEFYYVPQKVASLKGIEYFTSLVSLDCREGALVTLDLSKNTALEYLNCYNNSLPMIDVSSNVSLKYLDCSHNPMVEKLLDISKNTALEHLICSGNSLTALKVGENTALQYLDCYNNQLTDLDVNSNTALIQLDCSNNQLMTLDVSKNTVLERLYCYNNQLTELDVSKNTALQTLYCDGNQLTDLDVNSNTALIQLACYNNQLTTLDVSKNTALQELYCYDNQLTELDVSQNTDLRRLNCDSNQLTSLDVSKNVKLGLYRYFDYGYDLSCSNNQITTLDLSNCPALSSSNVKCDSGVTITWPSETTASSAPSISNAGTAMTTNAPNEIIILASIPTFRAERTGKYSFDVSLDRTVSAGSTLIFKNSSENLSGVFLDENGEEITMPTTTSLDRVKVSANFVAGSSYTPVVAANLNNGSSAGGQGGGCVSVGNEELGLRSLFILLMCAFGVSLRRKCK